MIGISLLPFFLDVFLAFGTIFEGTTAFCFGACTKYYGWDAFLATLLVLFMLKWPILIIGFFVIVVSACKINKLRKLFK